jgi:hypothetical protein
MLNIAMREDPGIFLHNDDYGTPQFSILQSRYWSQFDLLRPHADAIRDRIRDAMGSK